MTAPWASPKGWAAIPILIPGTSIAWRLLAVKPASRRETGLSEPVHAFPAVIEVHSVIVS